MIEPGGVAGILTEPRARVARLECERGGEVAYGKGMDEYPLLVYTVP